jgi:hypothetical protein
MVSFILMPVYDSHLDSSICPYFMSTGVEPFFNPRPRKAIILRKLGSSTFKVIQRLMEGRSRVMVTGSNLTGYNH